MSRPKSLTGIVASIEVQTLDWHAGLSATQKHVGKADELPLPIRPKPEDVAQHRTWQDGWLKRLPEPDPEPVAIPQPVTDAEADEAGDE